MLSCVTAGGSLHALLHALLLAALPRLPATAWKVVCVFGALEAVDGNTNGVAAIPAAPVDADAAAKWERREKYWKLLYILCLEVCVVDLNIELCLLHGILIQKDGFGMRCVGFMQSMNYFLIVGNFYWIIEFLSVFILVRDLIFIFIFGSWLIHF